MQCKNVLIPTDGTDISKELIEFFCSIQKVIECVINVAYVIEVPRSLSLTASMPEEYEKAKAAISDANKISEKYGVIIHTSIIYARTKEDSIIHTAEDLRCDTIASGQGNERPRIFANANYNIYQKAKCNVWIFNSKQSSWI